MKKLGFDSSDNHLMAIRYNCWMVQIVFSLLELLVDDVETEGVSSPLHLGDQVTNILLGLNLLLKVFSLDEVSPMGVTVGVSLLVKVQQGLVNLLFKVERSLN